MAMTKGQRKDQLRTTGVPSRAELEASPGYPSRRDLARGPIAVIECVQDIPCNPCEIACSSGAIFVGDPITNRPVFRAHLCNGCGRCIPVCPGQAIFRVDTTQSETTAAVSFPYEFLPLPEEGDAVEAVDRAGEVVCEARVLRTQASRVFDRTAVITVEVPQQFAMDVRSIKRLA